MEFFIEILHILSHVPITNTWAVSQFVSLRAVDMCSHEFEMLASFSGYVWPHPACRGQPAWEGVVSSRCVVLLRGVQVTVFLR